MKKILGLLWVGILALSCSTPGVVVKSTKGTRAAGKVIRGEWVLNSITYNQSGKFDVTLLQDASADCFQGSTWKFVNNNFRGTYQIEKDGECISGKRHFIFVVQEVDKNNGYYDFLLKPTNEKYQSPSNTGIRLHLAHLSETEMVWEQTLNVGGKPFVISMNFSK